MSSLGHCELVDCRTGEELDERTAAEWSAALPPTHLATEEQTTTAGVWTPGPMARRSPVGPPVLRESLVVGPQSPSRATHTEPEAASSGVASGVGWRATNTSGAVGLSPVDVEMAPAALRASPMGSTGTGSSEVDGEDDEEDLTTGKISASDIYAEYVAYSLREMVHPPGPSTQPTNPGGRGRGRAGSQPTAVHRAASAPDEDVEDEDEDGEFDSPLPALSRRASVVDPASAVSSPPVPHYHARQFTMAFLYYRKHHKREPSLTKVQRQEYRARLHQYLASNVLDWMPPTPKILEDRGAWAFFWGFEQYFMSAVWLPIGVLFLHGDSDFARLQRNILQTWTFTLSHTALPSSEIKKLSRGQRILMSAVLVFFYLSLVVPIPFRYWALYEPFGGDLTSRIDCWFPPALAALMNVCVAAHAVVAHTYDTKSVDPALQRRQDDAEHSTSSRSASDEVELVTEGGAPDRYGHAGAHRDSIEVNSVPISPAAAEAAAAEKEKAKAKQRKRHHLFAEPNELEKEKALQQEILGDLTAYHADASSFLRTPSVVLTKLCANMVQHDFRRLSPTSGVFLFVAVCVSLLPNVVSVAWGGHFLGDCTAHTPSQRECPFPMAAMRLAVFLRLLMLTITVYFFSFVLHQIAVYFRNKTLIRQRMLILLSKILGSDGVHRLVDVQRQQLAHQQHRPDGHARKGTMSPSAGTTVASPSTGSGSSSPAPSTIRSSDSSSGDLSRLPTDLAVWFSVYRFMDEFDRRDGWQVQATLAWYAGFVLFCCSIVLLAVIRQWQGVDQLVLYFTCALVAGLVGTYVMVILVSGMQINELPTQMHDLMRRAEMRVVLALAIVQRDAQGTSADVSSLSLHTLRCSLQVSASLLQRFASSFSFTVMSSPFSVLGIPLTKTLISTAVIAGLTALASVAAATISGAIQGA